MPEDVRMKISRYRRVRLPRRIRQFKIMSRHPFAVPFITLGLLIILTGGIYLVARQTDKLPTEHDAKIVIISYDNQQRTVPSKKTTVGELLKKLHLNLGEGDVVEPSATAVIDQDQFRINIYRAVPVEIVDGGHRSFALSAAKTPRAMAQQAGSNLYPEDRVTTAPATNFIKNSALGEEVVIDRATAINVDLYGTPVVLRTHAATVGQLIREKGIKLEKKDQVVPALNTPITPGQKLSLIRTGIKVVAVTEEIAMPVETISDPTLAYGTTAIRQQGTPGQQVVTYEIALTNNVETSRKVIQKVVNKTPVKQVAVVGSSLSGIKGDMARAGIAPGDYQYADYIISRESGWCPTKWQGEYGGCPPYHGTPGPGIGYGLGQATPGSKMSTYGADWATNPVTQLKWANGYAKSRFGSWQAAYNYWVNNHHW